MLSVAEIVDVPITPPALTFKTPEASPSAKAKLKSTPKWSVPKLFNSKIIVLSTPEVSTKSMAFPLKTFVLYDDVYLKLS